MNRKTLAEMFLSQGATPWKTFLLEVHDRGEPEEFLDDLFGAIQVHDTEDRFLHTVVAPGVDFTVDHLDDRFWSFHSESGMGEASRVPEGGGCSKVRSGLRLAAFRAPQANSAEYAT